MFHGGARQSKQPATVGRGVSGRWGARIGARFSVHFHYLTAFPGGDKEEGCAGAATDFLRRSL
jgi:hypothetical protein